MVDSRNYILYLQFASDTMIVSIFHVKTHAKSARSQYIAMIVVVGLLEMVWGGSGDVLNPFGDVLEGPF